MTRAKASLREVQRENRRLKEVSAAPTAGQGVGPVAADTWRGVVTRQLKADSQLQQARAARASRGGVQSQGQTGPGTSRTADAPLGAVDATDREVDYEAEEAEVEEHVRRESALQRELGQAQDAVESLRAHNRSLQVRRAAALQPPLPFVTPAPCPFASVCRSEEGARAATTP